MLVLILEKQVLNKFRYYHTLFQKRSITLEWKYPKYARSLTKQKLVIGSTFETFRWIKTNSILQISPMALSLFSNEGEISYE